uniref:Uncharacterized protein n=1 Tax=Arundo donax TaxID=35708 RepID=A0A0A9GIR6_ARUDO
MRTYHPLYYPQSKYQPLCCPEKARLQYHLAFFLPRREIPRFSPAPARPLRI